MNHKFEWVSLAITIMATCPCVAQDLETILAAHESSTASLQYLRCNYTNTSAATSFSPARVLTGTITRGPSTLVVTARATDFESLLYVRPDRVECALAQLVESGGKRERYSSSNVSVSVRSILIVDPFRDMLIKFLDGAMPNNNNTLRKFINSFNKPVDTRIEGKNICLSFKDNPCTIRIAPLNNYLVSGIESSGGNNRTVSEKKAVVSEFTRTAEGVVVPTVMAYRVTNTTDGNTTTLWDHTTKLTNIDTKPFDEKTIRVRYPRDTKVTNMIDGTEYMIDEDGKILGDVKPSKLLTVLTSSAEQKQLPTSAEPARSGWWIFPAAISLLAIAAGTWLLARRRRNSA